MGGVEPQKRKKVKGKISFLKAQNGYGFIQCEGKDLFFHYTDFLNKIENTNLQLGDWLEFEMGSSEKGQKAQNIKLVSAESGD